MSKYLITLDVDGTLLDNNYRSNSPTINSVIGQLTREGHVFIINSNRSLEDMQSVARLFELRGLLIGENGCFIYNQETGATEILLSEAGQKCMREIRTRVWPLIEKKFPGAKFMIGDTTDINKHIDAQDIPAGCDTIFIMNEFREYSISVHAKKIANGRMARDVALARLLFEAIDAEIKEHGWPARAEYTESYANVLVLPTEVSKPQALHRAAEHYPNYEIVVIGDDAADKPVRDEIDFFFVVNNATPEAKSTADYVAEQPITKGVEEILLKIDSLIK